VQKLLQIASGAVYSDPEHYELIDRERYELVADLAEERAHSIVFFLWKHQKIELIKEFESRGLSYTLIDGSVRTDTARTDAVRRFQNGEVRILLAHPKSAGHGLTLTRASATIWASPTYDYEFYEQGFRRIYRATQTQPTETIFVIAPKTADVRAVDVLLNKGKRQHNFLWLIQ
jgi:SNF2 family DNA or RNA helicase